MPAKRLQLTSDTLTAMRAKVESGASNAEIEAAFPNVPRKNIVQNASRWRSEAGMPSARQLKVSDNVSDQAKAVKELNRRILSGKHSAKDIRAAVNAVVPPRLRRGARPNDEDRPDMTTEQCNKIIKVLERLAAVNPNGFRDLNIWPKLMQHPNLLLETI